MKKLLVLLFLPILLMVSCTNSNTYTMETFYNENKGSSDTTLVGEKDNISAGSDSAAFIKAQEKFNDLVSKSGVDKDVPLKFTLRDKDGVIITGPGQAKTQQVEKEMYPNQKP